MRSAFAIGSPNVAALRALNYSPFLEAFRQPRRNRQSLRLGDLLTSMGAAYGSVFTRLDCKPSHGIELISQTDMFAAEPSGRVIRLDSMANPERHRVKRWQVLIAGAGTLGETELYGRSIIADTRLVNKFVGPHAMVLTFHEPGSVDNLYVYAFLCTKIGISLVRSTSYGTKILSLRKDTLADLHIPNTDPSTKSVIADLVRAVVEARETYVRELHAARAAIEELPEVRKALQDCSERTARCVLARAPLLSLAGKNHAMLGNALHLLRRAWNTQLSETLEPDGIYNGPRFARIHCTPPHGVDFLAQRDIFTIRQVVRRIIPPPVNKRLLFVPRHALVVASHGQFSEGSLFGKVETAGFGFYQAAITQDILRILPKPEMHDWLYAFLSSRLGFALLKSTAIGTSIPMMRPDLLAALPYPPITHERGERVSHHVKASIEARIKADASETEAIRIVEQEVLPSWLS